MGRSRRGWSGLLLAVSALLATPASAQSARDLLIQAAFADRAVNVALERVDRAHDLASSALRRAPGDREAAIVQATALGYRAKLTGSRTEAIKARKRFEALVAQDPRNPEAHVALGAWHVGVIVKYGSMLGRAAVGAQRAVGLSALDRAVTLSGNRAMFTGLAALLRLELDPADPKGRALAEAASKGATPTPVDRAMQRAAQAVLTPLRAGDKKATRAVAELGLPLGRLGG